MVIHTCNTQPGNIHISVYFKNSSFHFHVTPSLGAAANSISRRTVQVTSSERDYGAGAELTQLHKRVCDTRHAKKQHKREKRPQVNAANLIQRMA